MEGGIFSNRKHPYNCTISLGEAETDYFFRGEGGHVDDCLFAAIPDGGDYGGYSYYEFPGSYRGGDDGRPAHLPKDPGNEATGGRFAARKGKFTKLERNIIIPKGTRFYFWVSGMGSMLTLTNKYIKPVIVQKLIIKSQAIPKPEYEMWFEPSDIVEKYVMLIKDLEP